MSDDQFFGLIAGTAVLVWLLSRGVIRDPRMQRLAAGVALAVVVAGIGIALVQTFVAGP